jgi:hypothetical protein
MTTKRPLALIPAAKLSWFPCAPVVETLTRVVGAVPVEVAAVAASAAAARSTGTTSE